jgi:hypothetical protein
VLSDDTNEPAAGVAVGFEVVVGHGSLAGRSAQSGPDGIAAMAFTCGPEVGPDAAVVEVLLQGDAASGIRVSIDAEPGPPAELRFSPPDSAPVLLTVPLNVEATLGDRFGNPVAGATVLWKIESGGGSLSSGSSTASPAGTTTNQWTLGGAEGVQSISAMVAGTDVLQSLHVRAVSQPLQIVPDEPPGTAFPAGVPAPGPFRVRVLTAGGLPVRNAPVLFEPVRPGRFPGSDLDDGTVTPTGDADPKWGTFTDQEGYASVSYLAATRAGSLLMYVSMPYQEQLAAPVQWTDLSIVPGPLASLAVLSGDGQAGVVGHSLALPLVVEAQDQYGNRRCSETVTWTADHGGSLASEVTPMSDCHAQNTWTLGPDPTTQTAVAAVGANVSVAFTATASP